METGSKMIMGLLIYAALSVLTPTLSRAQSEYPFVSAEFQIPEKLQTQEFRLRMLTVNDVVKDYDAVMTSVDHLAKVWPGSGWPEGLTFEQDLIDLGWHQKEFQIRRSFAYTAVNISESEVLGCVYVNPIRKRGYEAEVYLWVRKSELGKGLDSRLLVAVKGWLEKEWPLKNVAFPGRDIDWKTWNSIPDEKR